jgi:hypothetical protein
VTKWFKENEHLIFPDYLDGELVSDIERFVFGKGGLHKVLGFFFDRLRYSYRRHDRKYSPMQILNSEELLELVWQRIESKPQMFKGGRGDVHDFCTAVMMGYHSKLCDCGLLANFPAKEAKKLFSQFCPPGGLIFDPSAGFGSRMGAALLGGYGYVATDPNKDLLPLLQKFYDFLIGSDFVGKDQEFKVFCQGSEVEIPELCGKVDFAFTSPPYFNLEHYSDDGFASTRNYGDIRLWVKEFVVPTIVNVRNYLKPGSCVATNIKNTPSHKLYDIWRRVFLALGGFKELEPVTIAIKRRHYAKGVGGTLEEKLHNYYKYADQELCMVFQKE